MQGRLCISPDLVLDRLTMRSLHLFIEYLRPFIRTVTDRINAQQPFRTAVLRAAEEHPKLASAFEICESTIEDTFGLRFEHLFPVRDYFEELNVRNRRSGHGFGFTEESDIATFGRILALCARGDKTERDLRQEVSDQFVDDLLAVGTLCEFNEAKLQVPRAPGIVRLQHAGLLYRTETTGVLVDPQFSAAFDAEDLPWSFTASDVQSLVDAIVISHSHEDHWSPTSLLFFPRDLPIIIPHVPRLNLLAHDMADQLGRLGFTNVIIANWYSPPITIGDIQIHPLPFYGEQPLRTERPRHPDLRNWGNTYFIKTPRYSSWFLIDSGDDPDGSMSEVAEYVASHFGGVDLLLSNLDGFQVGKGRGCPFYATNAGHYWLSLSARQMARFPSIQETVTLAPAGVADVARIARAKTFLPYAHWWAEPGAAPVTDDELVQEFQNCLAELKFPLVVRPWSIGDGYFLDGRGQLQKHRCW